MGMVMTLCLLCQALLQPEAPSGAHLQLVKYAPGHPVWPRETEVLSPPLEHHLCASWLCTQYQNMLILNMYVYIYIMQISCILSESLATWMNAEWGCVQFPKSWLHMFPDLWAMHSDLTSQPQSSFSGQTYLTIQTVMGVSPGGLLEGLLKKKKKKR